MDTKEIKSKFPIFKNKINGKQLVYLDSSNSAQKPMSVIKSLDSFYKKFARACFADVFMDTKKA